MQSRKEERVDVRLDTHRLDIAMALRGIRSYIQLADEAGMSARNLQYAMREGRCTFDVLNKLAVALGVNPIDLLVTPGHPDPKLAALVALSA